MLTTSSVRRRVQGFSSDAIGTAVGFSWTIVGLLFALLIACVVVFVATLKNARGFKKAAPFLLFPLGVLLSWMGPETDSITAALRNVDQTLAEDAESSLGATLAGYIAMFLALILMAAALLLAAVSDDAEATVRPDRNTSVSVLFRATSVTRPAALGHHVLATDPHAWPANSGAEVRAAALLFHDHRPLWAARAGRRAGSREARRRRCARARCHAAPAPAGAPGPGLGSRLRPQASATGQGSCSGSDSEDFRPVRCRARCRGERLFFCNV